VAINLSDLRTMRADKPPLWLIYGPPKIGKTTLASEFPNAVFVQTEEGTPVGAELTSFGVLDSYGAVEEALAALFGEHDLKTVIIDSLSALEPLIWREVCERNKWSSIELPGYGKGYVEADLIWRDFVTALLALRRTRGMTIVLIAHSEIKRIEDPIHGPLDRYAVQLHKRAVDIIYKECDVIAFMNYRISVQEVKGKFNQTSRKGVGAGQRVIYFADRPGFVAGNRRNLPDELDYRQGEGFAAIASGLAGEAAPEEDPRPKSLRRAAAKEAA
jgi:hypothetical protein